MSAQMGGIQKIVNEELQAAFLGVALILSNERNEYAHRDAYDLRFTPGWSSSNMPPECFGHAIKETLMPYLTPRNGTKVTKKTPRLLEQDVTMDHADCQKWARLLARADITILIELSLSSQC
jgi:hypothetical protein